LTTKLLIILIISAFLALCSLSICLYLRPEFYSFMEKIGVTSFDAEEEMAVFEEKAKDVVLYAETEEEQEALNDLLSSEDDYVAIYVYDEESGEYIAGNYATILDELGSDFFPIETLMLQFDEYIYQSATIPYYETVRFKDVSAEVLVNTFHPFKVSSYYFYFSIILSILIFLLPTLIFVRKKMKHINQIHKEVSAMEEGNLDTALSIKGDDEIASLSKQIDSLRIALAENIEKEEESRHANYDLISAMSHDLRTPLTTLNGYLEIIAY
ncbi:MAG: histidine kinase dimerization/phospho-acceptor domain-containing protein, partial [Coprobacillaceae bacterium]